MTYNVFGGTLNIAQLNCIYRLTWTAVIEKSDPPGENLFPKKCWKFKYFIRYFLYEPDSKLNQELPNTVTLLYVKANGRHDV